MPTVRERDTPSTALTCLHWRNHNIAYILYTIKIMILSFLDHRISIIIIISDIK